MERKSISKDPTPRRFVWISWFKSSHTLNEPQSRAARPPSSKLHPRAKRATRAADHGITITELPSSDYGLAGEWQRNSFGVVIRVLSLFYLIVAGSLLVPYYRTASCS